MRNQFSKLGSNPSSQSLQLGRAGECRGGFGVGGPSSDLGTNPFLHGRVGGRNGNDGQEKTNYKIVTREAF